MKMPGINETAAIMIFNIVTVCIFGFLAYWFNRWWIALFSGLFILEQQLESKADDKKDDNE